MARKIEDWTHHPLRDPRKFAAVFAKLREREIAVVGGAFLDSLLADLVALGLRDDPKEIEDFVGLDADGRAPVGSFGARIQMAYLLGLIDKPSLQLLRYVKDVRNLFSHHVSITFLDERVVAKVRAARETFIQHYPKKRNPKKEYPTNEELEASAKKLGFSGDACVGYFVGIVTVLIKELTASCRRRKSRRRSGH